jgi:hypothetical protein
MILYKYALGLRNCTDLIGKKVATLRVAIGFVEILPDHKSKRHLQIENIFARPAVDVQAERET